MRYQKARQGRRQFRCGKSGKVGGVAIEVSRTWPGRQTARPRRAALTAPVEAPYLDTARRQVPDRLELFFNEFAKAADQHALRARSGHWQMAPAEGRAVASGEAAPDEFRWRQEPIVERRPARRFSPERDRGQAIGPPNFTHATNEAGPAPLPRGRAVLIGKTWPGRGSPRGRMTQTGTRLASYAGSRKPMSPSRSIWCTSSISQRR